MYVINDIDAADECDFGVNHRQLAVQAPQPLAAQRPERDLRTEFSRAHARIPHALQQVAAKILRTETVDQQVRHHAAPCRAHQCLRNAVSGHIAFARVCVVAG